MLGVVGLDLSLSNSGMCYIPPKWDGQLKTLSFASFGTEKAKGTGGNPHILAMDESNRRLRIANSIVGFIKINQPNEVAIEGYAFSFASKKKGGNNGSASLTRLGELGGSVKDQIILGCKRAPIPIPSNAARKTVIGSLKRGKVKDQVKSILAQQGLVFPNLDIMDAFVVGYAWYCTINKVESLILQRRDA